MKTFIKQFFILMLFAAVLSCKKSSNKPVDPDPTGDVSMIKEHGAIVGDAIKKNIGPTGGTINTIDGNIKLVIPAGAVDANVDFSIQEVVRTVGVSGVGKSYRLLPENVQFKKDIELIFHVEDSVLTNNGAKLDLLRLVYQDSKGYWHFGGAVTLEEYNKNLIVKTRHFSDWSLMSAIKIVNTGKEEIFAGETTTFKAVVTEIPAKDFTDDMLLEPVVSAQVDEWLPLLPQEGSITGGAQNATYTAPTPVTFPQSIHISAYFRRPPIISGHEYSRFSVNAQIRILPDEFLIWGRYGYGYAATGPTLEASINSATNRLTIIGREGIESPKRLTISCESPNKGQYNFDKDYINYVSSFQHPYGYRSIYTPCNMNEDHTLGAVIITKNDGVYIEGVVQGEVKNVSVTCSTSDLQPILAKFRIKKP